MLDSTHSVATCDTLAWIQGTCKPFPRPNDRDRVSEARKLRNSIRFSYRDPERILPQELALYLFSHRHQAPSFSSSSSSSYFSSLHGRLVFFRVTRPAPQLRGRRDAMRRFPSFSRDVMELFKEISTLCYGLTATVLYYIHEEHITFTESLKLSVTTFCSVHVLFTK